MDNRVTLIFGKYSQSLSGLYNISALYRYALYFSIKSVIVPMLNQDTLIIARQYQNLLDHPVKNA